MNAAENTLRLTRAGIDTYRQSVVYMNADCHVCLAEGFAALTRVRVDCEGRTTIAMLNIVVGDWLPSNTAALSEAAWAALSPSHGARAYFSHAEPASSASALRAKVYGRRLTDPDFLALMRDTVAGRLSDIELAAFVTACAGTRLDIEETVSLTRAMLEVGEQLNWDGKRVLDKHCVGGLPGNRTSPIVVAIIAAAGEMIPKTSSRAITSPAGTADTMEVMTPVTLDLPAMRQVVEQEGGCIVWGGNVNLSPADDALIQIERPLNFDSEGQLVASVLSKKAAAGATHIIIDIPVGPTAKIRSEAAAARLEEQFNATAAVLDLKLSLRRTDGRQPVGYGIGPALEARDVLSVLRNEPVAPPDLRARALDLAGDLLDMTQTGRVGAGRQQAIVLLDSGAALKKFMAICSAQGGFTEPGIAPFSHSVPASRIGTINAVDNRRLARIAKLAGAPTSAIAGIDCRIRLGDRIELGQTLYQIFAASRGTLDYAIDYSNAYPDIFEIGDAP
jgi:thymidine phosphorylase